MEPEDEEGGPVCPVVSSTSCRSTGDQLQDEGSVPFLQEASLKYPLCRIAASRLASLWLRVMEKMDGPAIFSVGFWFLEQVGRSGGGDPMLDLGLVQCFLQIYQKNSINITSLGKEMYRKLLRLGQLSFLESIWLLTGAFSPILNSEDLKLFVNRLVKIEALTEIHGARCLTALLRLGVLERPLRRSLFGRILELEEHFEQHKVLLGTLILNGSAESAELILLSLRKHLCRAPKHTDLILEAFELVLPRLSPVLVSELFESLLKTPEAPTNYFKDYSVSKNVQDCILEAVIRQLSSADLIMPHLNRPDILKALVRRTNLIPPFSLELFARISESNLEYIRPVFKASFSQHSDKISALTQIFAQAKTSQLLQPGSPHFLVLLDAALEAYAEGGEENITSSSLEYPFELIGRIYEWACSINLSSLLPVLLRLNPDLLKDDVIVESMETSERIESLFYLQSDSDLLRRNLDGVDLQDRKINLEQYAQLVRRHAPQLASIDLIFAALTRPELSRLEDLIALFKSVMVGFDSLLVLISRLALIPAKPRNDSLFLSCLQILVKTLSIKKLGDSDSVFVLEAVQSLLAPYFGSQLHSPVAIHVMKSLCLLGNQRFRLDLTASLIRKVLDDTISVELRSTYVGILAAIPGADPVTIIGILASLSRDSRRRSLQTSAIAALARFTSERSSEIETLLPAVGELLWWLVNERTTIETGQLTLSLAEALGTDLVDGSNPATRILMTTIEQSLVDQTGALPMRSDGHFLLQAYTRILLVTRTFPRYELLLDLLSKRLDSKESPAELTALMDCLRWSLEWCPEKLLCLASQLLLPKLVKWDGVSLDLILKLCESSDDPVNTILDSSPPTALLTSLIPLLIPNLDSRAALQDLAMRSFQRAMELVSTREGSAPCLQGIVLLSTLIERLHGIPETQDSSTSVLSAYQPLIITIFGLATSNPNPLVRSRAFLELCRLASLDFYGLGIAEHPRLDRLLSSAFQPVEQDDDTVWPDLVVQLSETIMVAAWSYILAHLRLGPKFPVPDPTWYHHVARRAVSNSVESHEEYQVKGSRLLIGYPLAIRCALQDQDRIMEPIAVALMGTSEDSLAILSRYNLNGLIEEVELKSYLFSVPSVSVPFLDLLDRQDGDWCTSLLVAKLADLQLPCDDQVLTRVISWLSGEEYLPVLLELLVRFIDECATMKSFFLFLNNILPLIRAEKSFLKLYGTLSSLLEGEKRDVALQLISFSITFHSDEFALSPPIIKAAVMMLTTHIKAAPTVDCIILILCKSKNRQLKRAVVVKLLPLIKSNLTEAKRAILWPALEDLL